MDAGTLISQGLALVVVLGVPVALLTAYVRSARRSDTGIGSDTAGSVGPTATGGVISGGGVGGA